MCQFAAIERLKNEKHFNTAKGSLVVNDCFSYWLHNCVDNGDTMKFITKIARIAAIAIFRFTVIMVALAAVGQILKGAALWLQ